MCFLSVMIIISCMIGIFVFFARMINDYSESRSFNGLNLLGIAVCLITIASVFQFSTYTLESNIKNNHTYVLKGKVNQIRFDNVVKIENVDYNVNAKYIITPFVLSDFAENDKVEAIIADSVFNNYIVKIEKLPK